MYVSYAQQGVGVQDTLQAKAVKNEYQIAQQPTWNTDPLSPAKAAFYSAVLLVWGKFITKVIGKFLSFMELSEREFTFISEIQKNSTDTKQRIKGEWQGIPMMNFTEIGAMVSRV